MVCKHARYLGWGAQRTVSMQMRLIFLGGNKISSTRYIHYGTIDFVLGAFDFPQRVLTSSRSCQPLTGLRDLKMGWRRHRGNHHVRCEGGFQPSSSNLASGQKEFGPRLNRAGRDRLGVPGE
jgi:hypothetical protein